ncbi:MAG TPA: glycosyltransferase family 9 protein [Mucilaginibacter sp.]|jgi:lipopolysaccharide heptosyltransferase II|nr:glycosyltransferase family 9 protein [Mucilaginibacter sp.]
MKILIRLPNWLGDVVMSTAFIKAVKQLYPEARIDVIIKKELGDIAALISGIYTVHLFSKQEYSGLAGAYRFGKKMRSKKYDLFFNLPTSLTSAAMAWATRAAKRIGFGTEGGFFLLTNAYKKPANVHRVDEYISLLEQFTKHAINNRQVKLSPDLLPGSNKKVLINFNSEASSRRMPLHKGKGLINLLTTEFPGVTFTFIGSAKERAFIEEICESTQNPDRIENTAGKTNLTELCKLMAGATALLTTDSGPAHLANSLGTPVIVLFGAGNEQNTAPYNKTNLTVLRYGKLSCEPCVKNTCKLYGVPKCLEFIDNLNITTALKLFLNAV